MAAVCQVCEKASAIYKCALCREPYCSAACYQTHKLSHADDKNARDTNATPDIRPTSQSSKEPPLPEQFKLLLADHPKLHAELHRIYDTISGQGASSSGDIAPEKRKQAALAQIQLLRDQGAFETSELQRLLELGRQLTGKKPDT